MGGDGNNDGMITCAGCGKRFKWKLELAGKRVKCPCGTVILVPQRVAVLEGIYDLFEGEAQDAPPLPKAVAEEEPVGAGVKAGARSVGAAARTKPAAPAAKKVASAGGNPDAAAIAERLGIALPTRKRIDHTADVKAGRDELEQLSRGTPLRNIILPIFIILGGMILSFVQVRFWDDKVATTDGAALSVMATRAVISVALMLFSMFLLTTLADVNFPGTFQNAALRLCAIAIGPSGVYAALTFLIGGDMAGPFSGAMASIALYGILFWGLMRLDLQDTSICVIVTFSVVMISNYFAFKFAGLIQGSDI
jgi:DNA-directed RNA polymerase subunit RPC12/RpoP